VTTRTLTAAVTGASGYLGSRIAASLESEGWRVLRLVRTPPVGQADSYAYDLAAPVSREVRDALSSAEVLVHAAYDLSLRNPGDIWQVNVEGTRRLLEAARDAQTRRILVLSSMSAFVGTTQLYGRAKLEIEAMTVASGGCAVRPGLVHGDQAGGMAEALRQLTRLPLVPVIAGGAGLFTVREDDLMAAITALVQVKSLPSGPVSVAHPVPVHLQELMAAFAAQEDRRCRFVPVPWQLVYGLLRAAELFKLRLPFRADSLLGLVRSAPNITNAEPVTAMGVTLHAFNLRPC
jgi:nucleoside-diphosphate-sugar epimerase